MASREQSLGAYGWSAGPYLFDLLANLVYGPARLRAVRGRILDLLDLHPGSRVLELGCGSGSITRMLLERGTTVVAVDRAPAMLHRAGQKAPGARFVACDASEFASGERFDRVLLAFFLHELDSAHRVVVLRAARHALAPGGRLVIADHAAPAGGLRGAFWRRFVRTFEPPTVLEVIDGALAREAAEAGLRCESSVLLPTGRAQALVLS